MNYTTTHLEDAVDKLLNNLEIIHPSQLDIFIIAPRLGIDLIFSDTGTHFEGTTMYLNINLPPAELWFAFAHELCHIQRHAGNQLFLPMDFIALQEAQAENFALHFCMPTYLMKKIRLPNDIPAAKKVVASIFNVPVSAAEKRLIQIDNRVKGFS
ncbi:ImmA/IrrE family metallo-endopeptidase [Salimicrobium album]|uniref:Zn-dependent peptidase ImmA, M78 family n=1 Tax=Salimicrobium album TaxID=50717 RepID=A0A1H3D6S7_9BACI|nr:ImmA/IrrE family metallo-endopeptidase [Salimicrobium album]SDX61379.1 Zn-dependent peptidase ImmA, M78 family [Salimicrobium album]